MHIIKKENRQLFFCEKQVEFLQKSTLTVQHKQENERYLHRNICSGWSNRDEVRGICGGEYTQALSTDVVVDSYSASGIPALMLLFPAIR